MRCLVSIPHLLERARVGGGPTLDQAPSRETRPSSGGELRAVAPSRTSRHRYTYLKQELGRHGPPHSLARAWPGLSKLFVFRGRRECRAAAAAEWNIMHIHNSQLRKLIFIKSPSFTCTNYFCGENSSHHHAHKHGSTFSSEQPWRLNQKSERWPVNCHCNLSAERLLDWLLPEHLSIEWVLSVLTTCQPI